jgi:hypothetical protein
MVDINDVRSKLRNDIHTLNIKNNDLLNQLRAKPKHNKNMMTKLLNDINKQLTNNIIQIRKYETQLQKLEMKGGISITPQGHIADNFGRWIKIAGSTTMLSNLQSKMSFNKKKINWNQFKKAMVFHKLNDCIDPKKASPTNIGLVMITMMMVKYDMGSIKSKMGDESTANNFQDIFADMTKFFNKSNIAKFSQMFSYLKKSIIKKNPSLQSKKKSKNNEKAQDRDTKYAEDLAREIDNQDFVDYCNSPYLIATDNCYCNIHPTNSMLWLDDNAKTKTTQLTMSSSARTRTRIRALCYKKMKKFRDKNEDTYIKVKNIIDKTIHNLVYLFTDCDKTKNFLELVVEVITSSSTFTEGDNCELDIDNNGKIEIHSLLPSEKKKIPQKANIL